MDLLKILGWSCCIGIIMTILQVMNVQGFLSAQEVVIFKSEAISAVNVEGLYVTIKQILQVPISFYSYIESFNPEKSYIYTGIEGLTGASEKSFLRTLLYLSSFLYFFLVSLVFAKISTIFHSEKEQKIFFLFLIIIYFTVVKILGSI